VSGRRCVAAPRHIKRGQKRCTFTKRFGSFTFTGAAGAVSVRFSGRVGGRKLPPQGYTLTAVARTAAGLATPPRSAAFTIIR